MSTAAMCCGSWRLLCVGLGMYAVCRRLLINRFRLIVRVPALLKKLVAEIYVHRAQKVGCEGSFKFKNIYLSNLQQGK